MADLKSTRHTNAPRETPTDSSKPVSDAGLSSRDARLVLAIEAQRRRMFQVSAMAACLGHALADVYAPGKLAPELQNVTDVMIQLLDDATSGLDPTVLKLRIDPTLGAPYER
jgi:hypothetical protein